MHSILLVGTDEMLLRTRAAILNKTGSEAVCSDAASALAIQADRECDLVMLCHSLPDEVIITLAEAIREHWPKTRILLIQPLREWQDSDVAAAVDGVSSPEPGCLIGNTVELLTNAAREVAVRGGIVRGGPFAG